MPQLVMSNV